MLYWELRLSRLCYNFLCIYFFSLQVDSTIINFAKFACAALYQVTIRSTEEQLSWGFGEAYKGQRLADYVVFLGNRRQQVFKGVD